MTTGSVDSGGTGAACSGSLLCAIWPILSVFLVGLATTLTAGTDKFSGSPFSPRMARLLSDRCPAQIVVGRDAPRENPGFVGATA
jgi:hypothetical protein